MSSVLEKFGKKIRSRFLVNKTKKNTKGNRNKNKNKNKTKKNTSLETTFRTYFDKIGKIGMTPLDFLNKFYETVNSQINTVKQIIKTHQTSYVDSVIMPLMNIAKQMKINLEPKNYFLLLAANLMVLIYTTRKPTADNLWKTGKGGMPEIKKTYIIFSQITFNTFNSELNKWFATSYIGQPTEQIFIIDEKKMDPTNKNNSTYSLDRILNKIQIIDRTGAKKSYQDLNEDDQTYVFIRAYFREDPLHIPPIVLPTKLSVNLLPYFSGIKTVMKKDKELHEFQGEIGTNVPNVPNVNEVAATWAKATRTLGPVLNPENKAPTVYVSPPTNKNRFEAFKEGMMSDPSSAAAQPNDPIYDEPGNNSIPPFNNNSGNVNNLTASLGDLSMVNDPTYNTVQEPEYVGFNPAPPKKKKSGPSKKPDLNNIPENIEPTESVYGSLNKTRTPVSETPYVELEKRNADYAYAEVSPGQSEYSEPTEILENAFKGPNTGINRSKFPLNNNNNNTYAAIHEENIDAFKKQPAIVSDPRQNIEFPGNKSNLNEFQEHTFKQMGSRNPNLFDPALHNTSLLNNNNQPKIKGSLAFLPPNQNNGPQLQGPVSVSLPSSSDNERPETRPSSKKILIPGKIFNEVTSGVSGQFADKPGKGSTASKQACGAIFDFEKQFDEDVFLRDCQGKNVLIVSHNKRLQQLIGDMFPNFARQQSKKEDGCKFGIANCSVLEIYNTKSEAENTANYPNFLSYNYSENKRKELNKANANREQQSMTQHYFKLRVLFDGFPDKDECVVGAKGGAYTRKRGKKGKKAKKGTRKQRGGASSYHYLKKGDESVLGAFLTKDEEKVMRLEPPPSLFEKMFQAGAQKIILMRHGNGPHNKPYGAKQIVNPPLTALGVYQAYLAGQALNDEGILFDLDNLFVTTSQLKRAQQTTLQFLVSVFKSDDSDFISDCKSCLTNVYNADTRTILRNKPFIELVSVVENDKIMDIDDFRLFVRENKLVNPDQMIKAANTQEKQREKQIAAEKAASEKQRKLEEKQKRAQEAALEKQRKRIATAQSAAMKATAATEARIKAEQARANLNRRPGSGPFTPFPYEPRRNLRININSRRKPASNIPVGYSVRKRRFEIGGKKITKKRNNKKKLITKKRNYGKGNNKKGKGKQTRKH